MSKQVALVEDNDVIRENYTEIFTDGGFNVVALSDRHEAMKFFQHSLPDVAVLDIGLNEERDGGFQLCIDLRRLAPQLPIIFLTSRDEEFDRISGLRVGADDYVTKDIGINYLIVRIETLFQRIQALTHSGESNNATHTNDGVYGPLTMDNTRMIASWKMVPLDLSLTQFWILHELVSGCGEIRHYNKLMRAAKITVAPNTISAHIKAIRDSFRSVDSEFHCIKTERGAGYRWVDI